DAKPLSLGAGNTEAESGRRNALDAVDDSDAIQSIPSGTRSLVSGALPVDSAGGRRRVRAGRGLHSSQSGEGEDCAARTGHELPMEQLAAIRAWSTPAGVD